MRLFLHPVNRRNVEKFKSFFQKFKCEFHKRKPRILDFFFDVQDGALFVKAIKKLGDNKQIIR